MSNLKTAKAPSFKVERRTHSYIIMLSKWLVRCSHANWGNYVRKHTILWWFNFSTYTHTSSHNVQRKLPACGLKPKSNPKLKNHISFELGSVWKRANFGNFCRSSLRDDHVNATAKAITIRWACECYVCECESVCVCVFEFHSNSWRGNLAQRQIWLRRVEL